MTRKIDHIDTIISEMIVKRLMGEDDLVRQMELSQDVWGVKYAVGSAEYQNLAYVLNIGRVLNKKYGFSIDPAKLRRAVEIFGGDEVLSLMEDTIADPSADPSIDLAMLDTDNLKQFYNSTEVEIKGQGRVKVFVSKSSRFDTSMLENQTFDHTELMQMMKSRKLAIQYYNKGKVMIFNKY